MNLADLGLSNTSLTFGVWLLALGVALILVSAALDLRNMLPVGSIFLAAGFIDSLFGRYTTETRALSGTYQFVQGDAASRHPSAQPIAA